MTQPKPTAYKREPCYNPDCFDDPNKVQMHYHAADPTDDDFLVKLPKDKN